MPANRVELIRLVDQTITELQSGASLISGTMAQRILNFLDGSSNSDGPAGRLPLLAPAFREASTKPASAPLRAAANLFGDYERVLLNALTRWSQGGDKSLSGLQSLLNGELRNSLPGSGRIVASLTDGELRFSIDVAQSHTFSTSLSGNLGLPALSLAGRGNLRLQTESSGTIVIGVDSQGTFLVPSTTQPLRLAIKGLIPDTTLKARLGLLDFVASDEDADANANNTGIDADGDGHRPSEVAVELKVAFTDADADGKIRSPELSTPGTNAIGIEMRGGGNINLDMKSGTTLNLLPDLRGRFGYAFALSPDGTLKTSKAGFYDLNLDAAPFLSSYLKPLASRFRGILKPIQPILDLLTQPLINLDRAGRYSLLDLTELLGLTDEEDRRFIETLASIAALLDRAKATSSAWIQLGSLDLTQLNLSDPGARINTLPKSSRLPLASPASVKAAFADYLKNSSAADSPNASLLRYPIFDNPSLLVDLLSGKDVDLAILDLPELSFDVHDSHTFPVFTVGIADIAVELFGALQLGLNIDLGYDTAGIRSYLTSHQPKQLLEGFYVLDTAKPEAFARLSLGIGASVRLLQGLLSGGVTGRVFADLLADINDPNKDGKLRFTEFEQQLSAGKLFVLSGSMGLGFDFDLSSVGRSIYRKQLAEAILLRFGESGFAPSAPVLGQIDADGRRLILHAGTYALARRIDAPGEVAKDGDERFTVTQEGPATVRLSALSTSSTFASDGLTTLYWEAGEGDDALIATGLRSLRIDGRGGPGDDKVKAGWSDDTITGGEGNDTLNGDQGNDLLIGSSGSDQIRGGEGDDVLHAASPEDSSDDAANVLWGDGGDDHLQGSVANDSLFGGNGNDILSPSWGDDVVDGGSGLDTLEVNFELLPTKAVAFRRPDGLTVASAWGMATPIHVAGSDSKQISITPDARYVATYGYDRGHGSFFLARTETDAVKIRIPARGTDVTTNWTEYSLTGKGDAVVWTNRRQGEASRILKAGFDSDSPLVTLSASNDQQVSISADGSTIAWVRLMTSVRHWQEPSMEELDTGEIFVANADGSDERRITNNDYLDSWYLPDLSADGSTIVWSDIDHGIWAADRDGSNLRRLSSEDLVDDFEVGLPSISADGRLVAYFAETYIGGNGKIFLVNSDGSDFRTLPLPENINPLNLAQNGLSPDGEMVVFPARNKTDQSRGIYTAKTDGSGEATLIDVSTNGFDYGVSSGVLAERAPVVISDFIERGIAFQRFNSSRGSGQIETWGPSRISYKNIEMFRLTGTRYGDLLRGGEMADTLSGGDGNDTLIAGFGSDKLSGGSGNDLFIFNSRLDYESNIDKITDFSPSGGDAIRLSRVAFPSLGQGQMLNPAEFQRGPTATSANQHILYDPLSGALSYDPDGFGSESPIPFATIGANLGLSSSAFQVD